MEPWRNDRLIAFSEPVEFLKDLSEAALEAARERLRAVLAEALRALVARSLVADHALEAVSEFALRRSVSREAERSRLKVVAAVVTAARMGSTAAWRARAEVRDVREGYLTRFVNGGAVAVV